MKKESDTISQNLIEKVKKLNIITPKHPPISYLKGQLSGTIPFAYYS